MFSGVEKGCIGNKWVKEDMAKIFIRSNICELNSG